MPAYRAAPTLPRAAASVLEQDYQSLVLAVSVYRDDADTIGAARALGDDRVVVIQRPGRGIANGRNAALREVEADLYMFLDSDDAFAPGVVQQYVEDHLTSPFPALRYGDWTAISPLDDTRVPRHVWSPRRFQYEQLLLDNFIVTATVMIDREIVSAVGGFDERYSHAEDWDLWLRIARRYPLRHVPVNAAFYTRTKLARIYPRRFFLSERRIVRAQPAPRAVRLAATVFALGRYGAYYGGTLGHRRTLRMILDVRPHELAAIPAVVALRRGRTIVAGR